MKAQIISFYCVLRDPLGQIVSSSFNHNVITRPPEGSPGRRPLPHSDFHMPVAGLIEGLDGLQTGERRKIFVSAERAYGLYDPRLVTQVSRRKIPHGEALAVGYEVLTQAEDGECRIFRVVAANAQSVTLDGNHPLAGQDLSFDIEATSAREATAEEIAQSGAEARAGGLH